MTPLFSWSIVGKTLTVRDRSTSPHSSFTVVWGDGSPDTTVLYPGDDTAIYEYAEFGTYNIGFYITEAAVDSDTLNYQVIVADQNTFDINTIDLININLPLGLQVEPLFAQSSLRKWQLILSAISLDPTKLFEEASWNFLSKQLLSQLVIYDAIMEVMAGMATWGNASNSNTTGSGSSGGTAIRGPIKRIETGPSNVEFHDVSSLYQSLIQSSSISANGTATGFLGVIVANICYIGRSLKIHLPMCAMVEHPVPFKIFRRDNC